MVVWIFIVFFLHGFLGVALRVSSTYIVSLPIQRWIAFLKHLTYIHIVTYTSVAYTFRQQRLEDTTAQPRKHIDSLYHIALVTVWLTAGYNAVGKPNILQSIWTLMETLGLTHVLFVYLLYSQSFPHFWSSQPKHIQS